MQYNSGKVERMFNNPYLSHLFGERKLQLGLRAPTESSDDENQEL